MVFVFIILLAAASLTGAPSAAALTAVVAEAEAPAATLILLASFLGMALGPMLAVRLLHRRSARTLFGQSSQLRRHLPVAAALTTVVQGSALVIWFHHLEAEPGLDFASWLKLLPLSMIGLALQTGAEELVFRGYLLQQLAARFRSPLIWGVLPSCVFGLLHYDGGLGSNAWLIVAATTLFGLLAADLTAATGSLGAAWGLHLANNGTALLILAPEGMLSGLSLHRTSIDVAAAPWQVAVDCIGLLLAWFFIRRVLAR
ncbi:CPBP family intramembrane glutamic endopeptidase [Pseudoruegeria sp. HB172150]|uniref:CPBP family intramembrane glutamic endopeptidase n=1 Tax=Pseudoruegeria sp. HB172150 TaxID=2721164 RepID=UPI001C1318AE|nr:CPBP family intramembrane glutamic endopeptidase [Pseudoruegeria sp. HB172150]